MIYDSPALFDNEKRRNCCCSYFKDDYWKVNIRLLDIRLEHIVDNGKYSE
ncbi:MAG: hypothetical protein ACOC5T_02430 [Elusimicrobiota bacterium]